jgi:fatty-acyl-CoA synthase
MQGLMMDYPLTIPAILRRAVRVYPEKEIVSRMHDGSLCRITYGALYGRVIRLMNALRGLGVGPGDRVATFAWNSQRHLELYFAVPSLGAVLHTVNLRLYPEQIRFILQHAEDRLLFLDRSLAGAIACLQPSLPSITQYVVMDDRGPDPADLPDSAIDYEALLAQASETESFPALDEGMAAGLCYTSGTTGEPKGVLYSHRSMYLHAMGACMADSFAISERETVLPVVPMFHANAWGLPFACALTGAKQVFPGAHLLGGPLSELITSEQVTIAAGIPTVWHLLHQHAKQHGHDLSPLHTILSGGSASPRSLIEAYARDFGITVLPAWGMTELSPVGTVSRLRASMRGWAPEQQATARAKQGIPVPGVELRILDEQGQELPWDGGHSGELVARGPWVAGAYFKDGGTENMWTPEGWLRTGDIATIDAYGYVEITDRKKDMIKSRGEWISSVEMENTAMDHPEVREAAVVGRPDPTRGESPMLLVVLSTPEKHESVVKEVLILLARRFATWQLPKRADIRCVTSLPKTSVGKLDKKAMRANLEKERKE